MNTEAVTGSDIAANPADRIEAEAEGSPPGIARKFVIGALMPFAVPSTATGVRLFVVDFVTFGVAQTIAVLASHWWLAVLASLVAGFRMGGLYTLAHDAAHNVLTRSRPLNRLLGTLGYLVGFHNYRLRVYDHLVLGHHPHLNGPQPDAYRPMSWPEYAAAPRWRKAWERFTRSPNPFAFAPYCILSRWVWREFVPTRSMPAMVQRQAWPNTLLVSGYAAVWLGALWLASNGDHGLWSWRVFLTMVLPFLVFQTLTSAVLYFQHTHPDIGWFDGETSEYNKLGAEEITVHIQTPKWLSGLTHGILEHPAHHVLPAVPCYHLRAAQEQLARVVPHPHLAVSIWSLRTHLDTMRRCKLFDYERQRWLDFKGQPTT